MWWTPNRRRVAALVLMVSAAWWSSGCGTIKVSHEPPQQAHQPRTDLPPEVKQSLRDAARGSQDELALAAIKLSEASPGSAPDVAAYAAEIQPAAAPFVRSTLMAMFPDEATAIAIAVAEALPSGESFAPPPRATGHTFFHWP